MPRMAVGVTADEEEANDANSYRCQLQPSVAQGEVNMKLAFQNAFSQYTMTNHLEYALLSDISSIVNANNSVPFSLGEINWLLQILLREDHFTTLKIDQHGISTVQGYNLRYFSPQHYQAGHAFYIVSTDGV
ncbi:unnamed protein product [Sphagnum troendelagicum]|uniref:Uncharacterized protein n=1 Tax=Sphagnum troendelagicum TaxID=128251 RepID=A0ABP0UI24_9BRYO